MHQRWPKCGQCTLIRGVFIPVEEYAVEDYAPIGPLYRARAIVIGKCSHMHHGGEKTADEKLRRQSTAKMHEQKAIIDVPEWWGDAHVLDAIAGLVFFKPGGGAPEHGLVDRIS